MCCVALLCLFDLAYFFLPSVSSLIKTYISPFPPSVLFPIILPWSRALFSNAYFFFLPSLHPPFSLLPSPVQPPDLEYGLPVQVRDHALSVKDNLPQSDVNKEYFLQNMDKQVSLSTCIYAQSLFPPTYIIPDSRMRALHVCTLYNVYAYLPFLSGSHLHVLVYIHCRVRALHVYTLYIHTPTFLPFLHPFPPPPLACHHREDRGRWSGGQGPGSQRPPHEAGQNHALLQEKQTSHLFLLGEGRVQERGRMSLQVRGAVSLNLISLFSKHTMLPLAQGCSHTHLHSLSHSLTLIPSGMRCPLIQQTRSPNRT